MEEVAAGSGQTPAGSGENMSAHTILDQYICGVVRFQVACNARFRVFVPDCAYQLGFPRDQRQYLGNWTTETTAGIYTRDKRNVVEKVWKAVGGQDGYPQAGQPHCAASDWPQPRRLGRPDPGPGRCQTGAGHGGPWHARSSCGGCSNDRKPPQQAAPDAHNGREPRDVATDPGWITTPPPLGPLRVMSSSKKSRATNQYTVHLLTQEGKAVGCGWEPPSTKALDLSPEDFRTQRSGMPRSSGPRAPSQKGHCLAWARAQTHWTQWTLSQIWKRSTVRPLANNKSFSLRPEPAVCG